MHLDSHLLRPDRTGPDRRALSFPADELARRLGMQIKDVTKIAHRLLEDQIVQV